MILFGLFSRHRSLKLKMIKSDRNVDVGLSVVYKTTNIIKQVTLIILEQICCF